MPKTTAPELLQAGREAEQMGDLGLALAHYEAALDATSADGAATRRSELFRARALARVHLKRGDYLGPRPVTPLDTSNDPLHRNGPILARSDAGIIA